MIPVGIVLLLLEVVVEFIVEVVEGGFLVGRGLRNRQILFVAEIPRRSGGRVLAGTRKPAAGGCDGSLIQGVGEMSMGSGAISMVERFWGLGGWKRAGR
jgi:hypothetical protein